jgi:hypothetical protein
MINKFGEILFDDNKLPKYQKIATITMIVGLFIVIAYPYLTNKIFIVEKELKSSEFFYNQITRDSFIKSIEVYKKLNIQTFDDFKEVFNTFKNTKTDGKIISADIISQRGERQKMLLINFLYDTSSGGLSRNLFLIYALLSHFSEKANYHWLSKDIRINLVPRHLFYYNPKEFLENLDDKDYHRYKVDFILNLDLHHDLSDIGVLEFGINGVNSESTDMDYYKVLYDNLINQFKITTNRKIFTHGVRRYLTKIFNSIDEVLQNFRLIFSEESKYIPSYAESYIYLLENVISNYFLALGDINANHLFISANINAIVIKIRSSSNDVDKHSIQEYKSYSKEMIGQSFYFITALERILKNLSRCESDIFRGESNFILSTPFTFHNVSFILIILVLLTLKPFYKIVEFSQKANFDNIRLTKLLAYLITIISGLFIMFLEIEYINKHMFNSYLETFYFLCISSLVITFGMFRLLELNQEEYNFINALLTFIIVLNCYTVLFLNFGIGFCTSILFHTSEAVMVNKLQDTRDCLRHLVLCHGISYFILFLNPDFIYNIIEMFTIYHNSIYFFLSMIMIYYSLRLGLAYAKGLNLIRK